MTTITLPRATVEQALEALEQSETTVPYEGFGMARRDAERKHQAAITALRAALAQQAKPVACCDLEERKALSSVKLPCDVRIGHGTHRKGSSLLALVVRSRSLYQMAKSDDYYGYASRLAVALWEKHYKDIAPQWKPLDDLMGVLTQIDNMTSGLARPAQQAEPVEPWETRERFYEAIDRAVENVRQEIKVKTVTMRLPEYDIAMPIIDAYGGHVLVGPVPAPPQRKPLTEEEIRDLWSWSMTAEAERTATTQQHAFTRAVERAHGIKE